jgi:hypothetical protein
LKRWNFKKKQQCIKISQKSVYFFDEKKRSARCKFLYIIIIENKIVRNKTAGWVQTCSSQPGVWIWSWKANILYERWNICFLPTSTTTYPRLIKDPLVLRMPTRTVVGAGLVRKKFCKKSRWQTVVFSLLFGN